MANPNWATALLSFWVYHIPTAVNNTIPNWATLEPVVYSLFSRGRDITYDNASARRYRMDYYDASYFYFSRYVINYSASVKVRFYWMKIQRSNGAVTSGYVDVTS